MNTAKNIETLDFTFDGIVGSFMRVSDVLAFLEIPAFRGDALPVYTIDGKDEKFYRVRDISKKVAKHVLRDMECKVTTHMITVKE